MNTVLEPMFCSTYGCPKRRTTRYGTCWNHRPRGCGKVLGETTWGGAFAWCGGRGGMGLCLDCEPIASDGYGQGG